MHSRRKRKQVACFKQQFVQASISLVPVKVGIVARRGEGSRHAPSGTEDADDADEDDSRSDTKSVDPMYGCGSPRR